MTEKSTLDVLIEARAMIARESQWCQGARMDHLGRRCALGALDGVFGVSHRDPVGLIITQRHPATARLAQGLSSTPSNDPAFRVALFNNSHTHAEVIAMFDRAIAAERQSQVSPVSATVRSIIDEALAAAARVLERVG